MTNATKFSTKQILPFVAVVIALLAGGASSAYAHHETAIGIEESASVNGVNAMCTGVGITAREEAMNNGYPLRVEIAGRNGQYLGDTIVELSGGGLAQPIAVGCSGPWVLFDVPAGSYSVTTLAEGHDGESKTASVNVGGAGQARIVMQFPNLGGATSN